MHFFTNLTTLLFSLLTLFIAQASSQCTPTGPGVCNLGFIGHIGLPLSAPMKWDKMRIFDRYCNEIGFKNNPVQGNAVASQLPYTVVITRLTSGGDYNNIGFCYAGTCHDGGFWCRMEGGYNLCQHAFNC